ncbi:MAG: hypothetical protein KDD33_05135 [Bdellovibrionales bacterium]|nr:hypothetical protein [Bdellovibrionales bacterium]
MNMCILNKIKLLYSEVRAEIRDIIYIIKLEMDFEFDLDSDDLPGLKKQEE